MPLKKYIYWVDANLPPKTCEWLRQKFDVQAIHVFDLTLLSAADAEIFKAAKQFPNVIIITKDEDFVELSLNNKAFPKIIWITTGNISNSTLKGILLSNFEAAIKILEDSDGYFIEIS